jgi:hypothetical protein
VYNVTDVGAAIPYVGVAVKGAMDAAGNPQFHFALLTPPSGSAGPLQTLPPNVVT